MKTNRISFLIMTSLFFCGSCILNKSGDDYLIKNGNITIDGNVTDWESVAPFSIQSKDNLWTDPDLEAKNWNGKQDLSLTWKIAWYEQKLFILIMVTDDSLSGFTQEFTWLNDCIELHIDPENKGGDRIEGIVADNPFEERIGKKSHGYEMHFIPSQPPKVYVDDTKNVFYTDSIQNGYFEQTWLGEVIGKSTDTGYLLEIGFSIPNTQLKSGKTIGLDVAVCDDDGNGRETLMIWSGYQGEFWINMDNFIKMTLE